MVRLRNIHMVPQHTPACVHSHAVNCCGLQEVIERPSVTLQVCHCRLCICVQVFTMPCLQLQKRHQQDKVHTCRLTPPAHCCMMGRIVSKMAGRIAPFSGMSTCGTMMQRSHEPVCKAPKHEL